MVMIFSFDHMTGENHVLNNQLPASNQPLAILHPAFKFPPLPNPGGQKHLVLPPTNPVWIMCSIKVSVDQSRHIDTWLTFD